MFVMGMDALLLTPSLLGLPPPPPPHATSRTLASTHAPRARYRFISSSWSEILLKGVLVFASTCSPYTVIRVCLHSGRINEEKAPCIRKSAHSSSRKRGASNLSAQRQSGVIFTSIRRSQPPLRHRRRG